MARPRRNVDWPRPGGDDTWTADPRPASSRRSSPAFRDPGPFSPLIGGIVGGLLALWVTFVPCFLWIFLGAPYVERLRRVRRLTSALTAITAAVVGVILNLALWFGLHVLFARIGEHWYGPIRSRPAGAR